MAVTLKNVRVRKKDAKGNITRESQIVNPYTPEEAAAKAPKSTLKSTGETRPSVYNEKNKRFETPFTEEELQASKMITEQQRKKAIEEEILKQGQTTTTPATTETATTTAEAPGTQTQELDAQGRPLLSGQASIAKALPGQVAVKAAENFVGQGVSDLFFFMRNYLKKGNSIETDEAMEVYAKTSADINNDLSLVSQGLTDPSSVKVKINRAEVLNNRIAESANKWTNRNLKYYRTHGQNILEEVEINAGSIEDYKKRLEEASRKQQLNRLAGI